MSNPFFSLLVSVLSGSTRRKVKYWRIDAVVSYLFPIVDRDTISVSTQFNEAVFTEVVLIREVGDTLATTSTFNGLVIQTPVVVVGSTGDPAVAYYIDKDVNYVNIQLNSVIINTPVKSPEDPLIEYLSTVTSFDSVIIDLPVRSPTLTDDSLTTTTSFNSIEIT